MVKNCDRISDLIAIATVTYGKFKFFDITTCNYGCGMIFKTQLKISCENECALD